jgi:hypothetical protein
MAVPASPVDAELHAKAWAPKQLAVTSCTVSRWRGYVSSTFVALLDDGTLVAESPAFRSRGQAVPPDSGAARQAYDELRAELERLGWEDAAEPGPTWYDGRFTRLLSVPAGRPPADAEVLAPPPVVVPEQRVVREPPVQRVAPPRPEPPLKPAPNPPAVESAQEAPRQNRILTIVSVIGLVVALALGAYLVLGHAGQTRASAAPPVAAVKPAPVVVTYTHPPAAPAHAAPVTTRARPASVRLTISATERASWLEIRRGSATGPVLFSGELAAGKPLHLTGRRLWSRFGAAGNLTITANGHPVKLLGTFEHVFVAPER